MGTQRLERELISKLPDSVIKRVDSDTMSAPEYRRVLTEFAEGNIHVLMGTQIIAKGLDFPNVQLVGVVNADAVLALPDFRAGERMFQLLTHVIGRAGRSQAGAHVVLQTFDVDNPVLRLAAGLDYDKFAGWELGHRKELNYPPFSRLTRIIFRCQDIDKLKSRARQTADAIRKQAEILNLQLRLVGPTPAPLAKVADFYRFHLLLFLPAAKDMQHLLHGIREAGTLDLDLSVQVDVDPVNLM
jgi:primosomal protein N' (replication factor Y)